MEVNVAINIKSGDFISGANVYFVRGGAENCTRGRKYFLPGRGNISSPR